MVDLRPRCFPAALPSQCLLAGVHALVDVDLSELESTFRYPSGHLVGHCEILVQGLSSYARRDQCRDKSCETHALAPQRQRWRGARTLSPLTCNTLQGILERRFREKHQCRRRLNQHSREVIVGHDQSDFSCIALWTLGLMYLRRSQNVGAA
jgi:hypothetical protein